MIVLWIIVDLALAIKLKSRRFGQADNGRSFDITAADLKLAGFVFG